jgi:hypothetical protein
MPSLIPRTEANLIGFRLIGVLAAGAVMLGTASAALAWGATGHRMIGEAAILSLPADMPAFLHATGVAEAVGEIAREPDRARGAGEPHDHDLDPGHFVDVDDQGKVLGGPALAALPADRAAYDTALRAVGADQYRAGYLPYTIEDGFEQLVKDFAYWRVETAALKTAAPADRGWIAADRATRELLVIRDIGYWAHFVGDASQPLHVSVHYNGWGAYPNPNGYSQDKLHTPFEGPYVQQHLTLASVQAAMPPPASCAPIAACTAAYLGRTASYVQPLYALWGAGEFARATPRATAFATERVAAGAGALRDMIVAAWAASGDATVGYKPDITVKAAEAGAPVPLAALYGDD